MKVGIIGFGHLGQYLVNFVQDKGHLYDLELDFVWNRSSKKIPLKDKFILKNLYDIKKRSPDLIVEVAHPDIIKEYGSLFLSIANLMIGSPTAFSDAKVENELRTAAVHYGRGIYIPSGAFWGAQDIQKMAHNGSLFGLKVTMKKHPNAFKVHGNLKVLNQKLVDNEEEQSLVLYEGPVRDLCPLAPNNVNTMAAAAIAGDNLGFGSVVGCLISDKSLQEWHVVEVEVTGVTLDNGNTFTVRTVRKNPANVGVVTGSATFASFSNSLRLARNQGVGVHLC